MPAVKIPKNKPGVAPLSYEVLSPLNHDHELYEIGEAVELSEAEAARLIAAGVVAAQKADKPE